jgi:hypothetical protein
MERHHFEAKARHFGVTVLRARRRQDDKSAPRGQRAAGKITRRNFFY